MKRRDFLKQGITVSADLPSLGFRSWPALQALKKPQSGVPMRSSLGSKLTTRWALCGPGCRCRY